MELGSYNAFPDIYNYCSRNSRLPLDGLTTSDGQTNSYTGEKESKLAVGLPGILVFNKPKK